VVGGGGGVGGGQFISKGDSSVLKSKHRKKAWTC
jgi:hypothetical protein